MEPDPINMQENASCLLDESQEQTFHATDSKTNTRHVRWTRQETIVLIQAKLAVENRARSRSRSLSIFASDQNEPKWDSISSYCKQHGFGREPVQCQKRWSNLLSDFKKIKTWELQMEKEAESFWLMRSDLRRERKLPSLYDREVYDILDGKGFAMAATPLAHVTAMTEIDNSNRGQAAIAAAAAAEEKQENDDEEAEEEIGQGNEKETIAMRSPVKTVNTPSPISGEAKEKCPGSISRTGSMVQEGLKRRRLSIDGSEDNNWAKILKRNSNILSSQLEAQNINYQLDRDQRKEQADNLVAALNKLTDAMVRIANKL
ncbi:trihelix transcription factor ASR3-like [Durio zibethinus]|uniref:Trihelix transcription factor ASR3-like n=1 Tax=Durio zibethinus TaxID=66656 RepID=A0A6P6B1H2_DURZI|nr:trihelix transcription factor ASR3-like [Durio zibethinus]